MDLNLLRKIGLTEGEIRVYSALLSLGSSQTGQIMKKSGISSSKIYIILERLIHKGLVSHIIIDNVKVFQVTDPNNILEYIEKEKEELDDIKQEFTHLIPEIRSAMVKEEEESAHLYKGLKGIRSAYNNILEELEKGQEYCLFAISSEEAEDEKVLDFFTSFHKKRIEKGVKVRVISDSTIEKIYKKTHLLGKLFKIKHYSLTLPVGIVIGKNRIISISFGPDPIAHEIISERITNKYQDFFDKIWKIAKK